MQPQIVDEAVFLALLDDEERARAVRFHHAVDRLAYAAAHALLRTMLSEMAGGAPQAWRFVRSPTGKPRPDDAGGWPDIRFSLSHSRGMVACVLAAGAELGVDVEPLAPFPDALDLAQAHFAAREAAALQAMDEPARSEAFVRLWTLKEAAYKAVGSGLPDRLEEPEFDVRVVASSMDDLVPVARSDWLFRRYAPAVGFALSLARPVDQASTPVRVWSAEISEHGGLQLRRR